MIGIVKASELSLILIIHREDGMKLRSPISGIVALGLLFLNSPLQATTPTTVNPRYTLSVVGLPQQYWTMGIDFLSDGRMVLAVTDFMGGGDVPAPRAASQIVVVSGLQSGTITAKTIANMFRQPSGIVVVNNKIYMSDRDGFYQILDNNFSGDLSQNRKKVQSWPDEGTWGPDGQFWHQWVFTPFYSKGKFYAPYSGSIQNGGPSDVKPTTSYSGAFLTWDTLPGLTKYNGGLRSPNGANIDDVGNMMVCDNQGSYLPSSTFAVMKPNKFNGHKNSVAPNWAESLPYLPPVAWLIHDVNGRRSPSQPLFIPTGPYKGDWIMGDINAPGLMRVAIDSVLVAGEWQLQGSLSHFSQGMGPIADGAVAINRLKWGPDSAIYIGSFRTTAGNWSGGTSQPFYKLVLKNNSSNFEVMKVRSLNDGYEIEFSEPINPATATIANFTLEQRSLVRSSTYGGGLNANVAKTITGVDVSNDNRRVHLKVTGLNQFQASSLTHYLSHITVRGGLTSATGTRVWNDESWHTLNWISNRIWDPNAVSIAQKSVSLNNQVWQSVIGNQLNLHVDLLGTYRVLLRDLQGRLMSEKLGKGPSEMIFQAPKQSQGLYSLEVLSEKGHYSQRVTF